MRVKRHKTKEFEITRAINKIPNWNNPDIWEISHLEHFPGWYQELVNEVRKEVENYYNNGFDHDTLESSNQSTVMLRRLIRHLSNEMNIIDALIKSNGWKGKIGFAYSISLSNFSTCFSRRLLPSTSAIIGI